MREDSRRPCDLDEDELEERWAMAFGGKSKLLDDSENEEEADD